jgi:2-keto-4-pentenoate hydratase/2-oxohepta-3-ene-1,7-dioic acid hydratase in catechol pathway
MRQVLCDGPRAGQGVRPGHTTVPPEFTEPNVFQHTAELAIVLKGTAKNANRDDWRKVVLGYTDLINISARGEDWLYYSPLRRAARERPRDSA